MGVLQTILGDERGGHDAVGDEVLAEVEDALGHAGGALEAGVGVAVAAPDELGEGGGARPHLAGHHGVVDLLGPQRHLGAQDVAPLRGRQVQREVVVVDALPGLVRGAPRAAVAQVVEVGNAGVGVGHLVVARVVGHPAAEAAVEVEEVRGRDDHVVAQARQVGDVFQPVVPRLHDDVLGHRRRVWRVEDHVLPHHESARRRHGLEQRHGLVDPDLQQVVVGARLVGREEVLRRRAEVVAARLDLVAADVEDVVGKQARELGVDFVHHVVGLVVEDVQLARVGFYGRVVRPLVVGPP